MNYVTLLWSVIIAAAFLLAVVHAIVWMLDRRAYANLAFAVVAVAVIGVSWTELGMMGARTAAEWGSWVRWFQLPNFVVIVGTLLFTRLYMGTGRSWLMWTIIAMRTGILVTGFIVDPNFNFARIDTIRQIPFLGDSVSVVGHAVTAPWQGIATIATLLSVVFVLDASLSLWRTGTSEARRKTLVVGGGIVIFFALAILNTQLMVWGVWQTPTLTAPLFLFALIAMAYEMSYDSLRAKRLAQELRESRQALELAASAGGIGLWSWDAVKNRIWATDRARAMLGFDDTRVIELRDLIPLIQSDDLDPVRESLAQAAETGAEFEVELRARASHNSVRWIRARGRWELNARGRPIRIRGVFRDITEDHRTQHELEELRRSLAHVSRVSAIGQLTSALAHELRQPLAAIRSNVQVAQMVLDAPSPHLGDLREILVDIDHDERHAGEIIDRMRAMMKRQPMTFERIDVETLLADVVSLVRNDSIARGVTLKTSVDAGPLALRGDKVHLSQVLINLIINAMDAVTGMSPAQRHVVVRAYAAEDNSIEFAVTDRGAGISEDAAQKIFAPFFTTKRSGMGVGLSVSRMIIDAHEGRLWHENNSDGGATFRFAVPAFADVRSALTRAGAHVE